MKSIIAFFILLLAVITAQDQNCNPEDYEECGKSIESNGYTETCTDEYDKCADCIGCNQVCGWLYLVGLGGCEASPECMVAQYVAAAQEIEARKDCLGYLGLCCEGGVAGDVQQCVGCQQANIWGIMCNVYDGLKATLGFSCSGAVGGRTRTGGGGAESINVEEAVAMNGSFVSNGMYNNNILLVILCILGALIMIGSVWFIYNKKVKEYEFEEMV